MHCNALHCDILCMICDNPTGPNYFKRPLFKHETMLTALFILLFSITLAFTPFVKPVCVCVRRVIPLLNERIFYWLIVMRYTIIHHALIHYIVKHYIGDTTIIHCIGNTLHCDTLHCDTLHCNNLHCYTLRCTLYVHQITLLWWWNAATRVRRTMRTWNSAASWKTKCHRKFFMAERLDKTQRQAYNHTDKHIRPVGRAWSQQHKDSLLYFINLIIYPITTCMTVFTGRRRSLNTTPRLPCRLREGPLLQRFVSALPTKPGNRSIVRSSDSLKVPWSLKYWRRERILVQIEA